MWCLKLWFQAWGCFILVFPGRVEYICTLLKLLQWFRATDRDKLCDGNQLWGNVGFAGWGINARDCDQSCSDTGFSVKQFAGQGLIIVHMLEIVLLITIFIICVVMTCRTSTCFVDFIFIIFWAPIVLYLAVICWLHLQKRQFLVILISRKFSAISLTRRSVSSSPSSSIWKLTSMIGS